MEEGTGLSLYILVGSILFGLFIVMSATFGEGVHGSVGGMVEGVVGWVDNRNELLLDETGSESSPIVHNMEVPYEGFEGAYVAFFDSPRLQALGVTDDRHGFNEAIYDAGLATNGTDRIYVEYAVFDRRGNITERFVYGDKDTATHIAINDERLLPKGTEYNVTKGHAIGTGSVRFLEHKSGINDGKTYVIGTDESVDTLDRVHANK